MMIDIVFGILMLVAVFKGIQRGLIVALFSMLSLFIGLAAAIKFSTVVAIQLKDSIHISARWLPIIAFLLVFLAVILLVRWVANLIQTAIDFAWLGGLNKIGGVILYVFIYASIYSILLFYGSSSGILSKHTIESSVVYPIIEPWGPAVINGLGRILPVFKDMFRELEDFFSSLAKRG
jgi:membrane protein required for colicin V production